MAVDLLETSSGFYVDAEYQTLLSQMGLDSMAGVFAFQQGESLTKANLASWRQRIRFQLPSGQFAYLKRYQDTPKSIQLKTWLQHKRHDFLSGFDRGPAASLKEANVSIPQAIAWGGQWRGLFERRSFIITLELPHARSLEKQLPDCFYSDAADSHKRRREFITRLADFVRRFHKTGFRHRDLYLAHLFLADDGNLSLIDLHRCFQPLLLRERYRIKDIAQLHYSCPGDVISQTDRIRFYRGYQKIDKLTATDKVWIRTVHAKAMRIGRHDRKHGRTVPFEMKRKAR